MNAQIGIARMKDQADCAAARHPADARIRFHEDLQALELDLSGIRLADAAAVDAFYDRVDERVAASGEDRWFLLVDYTGSRIESAAWPALARRGRALSRAHSMGTVRCDASEATRRQIARAAGTEAEDPGLFADRDAALNRLRALPSTRRRRIVHRPTNAAAEIARRLRFLPDLQVLELDLSGFTLANPRDVDDLFDHVESRIAKTGRRWFLLIDGNGTRIHPEAWLQHARRERALLAGGTLGAVRHERGVAAGPAVRPTRAAALARIAELRAAS